LRIFSQSARPGGEERVSGATRCFLLQRCAGWALIQKPRRREAAPKFGQASAAFISVMRWGGRSLHPEFVADAEAEEEEEDRAKDGLEGGERLEPTERSIN